MDSGFRVTIVLLQDILLLVSQIFGINFGFQQILEQKLIPKYYDMTSASTNLLFEMFYFVCMN